MNIEDLKTNAFNAAELLKLMGNEKRLMILCQLLDGEKSVGELEELIKLKQSALSQHLAKLRASRIVHTRRESQTIYYSLTSFEAKALIKTLHDVYCKEED